MDPTFSSSSSSSSSLRWNILRQALLRRSDSESEAEIKRISSKATQGFNLIPCQVVDSSPRSDNSRKACVCYTFPITASPKLYLTQRVDNCSDLNDFEISNRYNIDNTGLVCQWPSEEVLAHFCKSQPDRFRFICSVLRLICISALIASSTYILLGSLGCCGGKRVIELRSGYGLAGLVIAAATEASQVVISDGNPQVVNCILLVFLCVFIRILFSC